MALGALLRVLPGLAGGDLSADARNGMTALAGVRRHLGVALRRVAAVEAHAIERVRQETKDYLEEEALFLRNEGLTVKCDVIFDDDPAAGIISYAKEHGPLFIAMATHGRGGLDHAVHGSVTEQVVRSGVAPVLTVRP